MKTQVIKPKDITRKWYIVDLDGIVLGRAVNKIAHILQGKHKPYYTPYLDTGDYVIVLNAEKVQVTGKKREQKMYYNHSGYGGGLNKMKFEEMIHYRPKHVIEEAVKGMLPSSKLGRSMGKKLFVYKGAQHPHQAQKPEKLEV